MDKSAEQRLTAAAHELDKNHHDRLEAVFHNYCAYGDVMNRTLLARGNWKKLCLDLDLLKSPEDKVDLELIFTKSMKYNVTAHSEVKMAFDGFIHAVAMIIVRKAPTMPITNPGPTVSEFMRETFGRAKDTSSGKRRVSQKVMGELLSPSVLRIWRREEQCIQRLFRNYAGLEPHMAWDGLLDFARSFKLVPTLISQPDLFTLHAELSLDGPGLEMSSFHELLGRVALHGFSRPGVESDYDTVPKKVNGVFEWIKSSTEYQRIVNSHEARTGAKERRPSARKGGAGGDGGLTVETGGGETESAAVSVGGRRMSRANMLIATGAAGSVNIEATARRRASVVKKAAAASPSSKARSPGLRPQATPEGDPGYQTPVDAAQSASHVDPLLCEKLGRVLARWEPRLRDAFMFYSRIGDPSNRGEMTERNFLKLLRDCDVIDDFVTPAAIHLQFVTVAKSRILDDGQTFTKAAARSQASPITRRASKQSEERSKRRSSLAGGALNTAARLDLTDFVTLLVRVSELIRSVQFQLKREAAKARLKAQKRQSVCGSLLGQLPVQSTGDQAFKEAKRVAEAFLGMVAPLGKLGETEDEIAGALADPTVVSTLKKHEDFMRRIFDYYVNAADGFHRLKLAAVLRWVREFEVLPRLLSRADVSGVFYATARAHGTDAVVDDEEEPPSAAEASLHGKNPTMDTRTFVRYKGFRDLVGRCAMLGMAKPFLKKKYPTPSDKITGFFQWMRASGMLRKIETEEWERGLSRKGQRWRKAQQRKREREAREATKKRINEWSEGGHDYRSPRPRSSSPRTGTTGGTPRYFADTKAAAPSPRTIVRTGQARGRRLTSLTPGVPPPPPLTEAQKRFVEKSGPPPSEAVAPPPPPPRPAASGGVSAGGNTPSAGGDVDAPLRAVEAALGALTDALDGSVAGLEHEEDVDPHEAKGEVLAHAKRLKRVAAALQQLVRTAPGVVGGAEGDADDHVAGNGASREQAFAGSGATSATNGHAVSGDARAEAISLVAHEMVGEMTRQSHGARTAPASPWVPSGESPVPLAGSHVSPFATPHADASAAYGSFSDGRGSFGGAAGFAEDYGGVGGGFASHGPWADDGRAPRALRTIHPGEDTFVARQIAGRKKAEAARKLQNRRLEPSTTYTGEPTRVEEFRLSPSKGCDHSHYREREAHARSHTHGAGTGHHHR